MHHSIQEDLSFWVQNTDVDSCGTLRLRPLPESLKVLKTAALLSCIPVEAFQTRTSPCIVAEATVSPSPDSATAVTKLAWLWLETA